MIGMEEGLMPHRRVIAEGNGVDEERRLCYVGVTRAEDTLTLSMCKSRTKWGKARPSIPSRFLMEMRGEMEKAARAAEAGQALVAKDQEAAAAAQAAIEKKAAAKKPVRKKTAAAEHGKGMTAPSSKTSTRPASSAPAKRPAVASRPLNRPSSHIGSPASRTDVADPPTLKRSSPISARS
jgi:ATP-dependent exoDNAse (exonuclease V) beta subunit